MVRFIDLVNFGGVLTSSGMPGKSKRVLHTTLAGTNYNERLYINVKTKRCFYFRPEWFGIGVVPATVVRGTIVNRTKYC